MELKPRSCWVATGEREAAEAAEKAGLELKPDADFLVVCGGDGTFASVASREDRPLLFVRKKGSVGALAQTSMPALEEDLRRIAEEGCRVAEMMRIECSGVVAFSDVYVTHRTGERSIRYRVEVEGREYTVTGSGVIFSTPQGSSGYTSSAGGPQVKIPRIVVTHICPYKLSKLGDKVVKLEERWHIAHPDSTVKFTLLHPSEASLHADGKLVRVVKAGEELTVRRAKPAKVMVLKPREPGKVLLAAVVESEGSFAAVKGGRGIELPSAGYRGLESAEELASRLGCSLVGYREFYHVEQGAYHVACLLEVSGTPKPQFWASPRELPPSAFTRWSWRVLYEYYRWKGRVIGE